MAAETLSLVGINRALSDYAGARACEELINLRPTTEGLVPVKDFSVKMANVDWSRIFVHHTTHGPKYIVIVKGTGSVSVQHVELENGSWVVKKTLFSVSGLTGIEDAAVEAISYASAGNIVLFSLCDRENSKYGNWAFTWKVTESGTATYVETEANVPEISYTLTPTMAAATASMQQLQEDAAPGDVVSVNENCLNAAQEENPDICVGPILIAIAIKTTDGKTFWTDKWQVYDPAPGVGTTFPPYVDENTNWDGPNIWPAKDWNAYFDKYGHAYATLANGPLFTITGAKIALTFSQLAANSWDKDTSILQSIEVYSSRPKPYLNTDAAYETFYPVGGFTLCLPQKEYSELNLSSQLLYHQASVQLASLAESDQTVNLSFGGNIQTTEETLVTDAGALVRYGRLLSYNARFHYWDSVSHIKFGMPSFLWAASGTETNAYVFVRWTDSERTELIYLGTISDYLGKADIVIAPSINIKEVVTYAKNAGTFYVKMYRMSESTSYNYSICNDGPYDETQGTGTVAEYEALIAAGAKTGLDTLEPASINVTEQYNPFVFLVEHSYLAPGNILEVQPQMAGIVDASYGRDPLNVFTERGLYALTQGSANVLYGAFLPLSDLVIGKGGGAVPTEMGTFFLADGDLWLVSGRRCTLISDALHLGPHKYIRACEGYQKIAGVDTTYTPGSTVTDPVYDISAYLSQPTFEEFVKGGARLSFNRFRMELFVSNPNYSYTYVLSLKYRQWFKISRRVWQDENGSDLANTPGTVAGKLNVIDLSTEVTGSVLVHLQSRPFSMGYQYSHIRRIVSMIRSRLSGVAGDRVVVGLYGSEDLQGWNLLAYAKRSGRTVTTTSGGQTVVTDLPLQFSQVRTTSAARSWRYYTICIGGQVPWDTDLGPFVTDYEGVIRRIG